LFSVLGVASIQHASHSDDERTLVPTVAGQLQRHLSNIEPIAGENGRFK
jgi:hypothetical protein